MKLSVIIPAYNEQERLEKTLLNSADFLKRQVFEHEIIVVSDGSTDKTNELVVELSKQIPNLKLIESFPNQGKGAVVKKGMLAAVGDARLFMDADNSTTIEQVLPMLKFLNEGFSVVVGSIEVKGAQVNEQAQWYRRWFGHWSKFLIRVIANLWDIKDTQRGFKLFESQAAEKIFSQVSVKGFGFDIEALVIAKKLGYKIKEVPVIWNNAKGSRVSLKSYLAALIDLCIIRFKMWGGYYK